MKQVNYKRLFSVQQEIEQVLKRACPNMYHQSGIYFYTRVTDTEKFAYIGQSVDVMQRNIAHLQGYSQKIDISIKKWGLYSPENQIGWHLNALYFPKEQLDEAEKFYINSYKEGGYELYNVESGGKEGKTDINERKAGKGYHDGLAQGYTNAQNFVANLFEKNLTYEINGKPTVNKQKALEKFEKFIKKG